MRTLSLAARGTVSLLSGLTVLAVLAYAALLLLGFRPIAVYSGSMRPTLPVGSLAVAQVRLRAAAFRARAAVPASVTADKLGNYFSVTPGSSVQPGSSTPVASGDVDTLALAFGTVPSARTFASVFTITDVSGAPRTAVLTLTGVPQIASAAFAKSGTTTVTLAAG